MKKMSCNIIRDILPLYADNVVSEDTKAMIEEHLGICEECCNELFALKRELILPESSELLLNEAKVLLGLKKRLQIKKWLMIVLSVLAIIGVLTGFYFWANAKQIYIPYEKLDMQLFYNSGYMWISYEGEYDEVVRSDVFEREVTTKKGTVRYKTRVVCIYDTFWSVYVEPLFWWNEEDEDGFIYLGSSGDLNQVYYGDLGMLDFNSATEETFGGLRLLWSDEY